MDLIKMGVETDLILNTGRSYDDVLASHQPSAEFNGVYAKGLDHFNVLVLSSILAGTDLPELDDPDDAMDDFEMVASSTDHSVGLWKLPNDVSNALKTLQTENATDIAAQWAQHPFFELMDWDDAITVQFLNDLSTMMASAEKESPEILMWVST